MTDLDTLDSLLDRLQGTLQFLSESGVSGLHCRPETLKILESWERPGPVPQRAPAPVPETPPPSPSGAVAPVRAPADSTEKGKRSPTLDEVRSVLGECTRCPLSETRRTIVFGEGNPDARLMFVGEGPGGEEDRQGRPFVGAAGRLLTKIIEAMGFSRQDVYIANIIKCRPPQNRNPRPGEIETCYPFLQQQIEAIAPEVICALVKFAAQTLLGTETPISRLRGRFHDYRGIPVMPTFHPAFLLRNADRKRDTWNDIQQIMARLGLERPS